MPISAVSRKRPSAPSWVYLLHFDRPFHHARHYCGMTSTTPEQRLARHLAGDGSKLVRSVVASGIGVKIVRVWQRDTKKEAYALERRLKQRKAHRDFCPECCAPLDVARPGRVTES